jgi:predicted dehydrogenase
MAPLRTVMIGFGRVAAGFEADPLMARWFPCASHLQCLASNPDFQLVGIADSLAPAREAARQSCPRIPVVATADELAELRPDVLVLAIPPKGRVQALAQLPSVRGLMLEKPLGPPSVRDPLFALCAERELATQVHYWRRGDPAMQALAGSRLKKVLGRAQAIFGLYGGGLYNNGSHLIDLVRMLLGPIRTVQATSSFIELERPALYGDGRINFVLELSSSAQVAVQALDFRCYREVSLDIWGEVGRLAIMQEGLFIASYPLKAHRGLTDAKEIASDEPMLLPIGSADATPKLYRNLACAINQRTALISPLTSAVATECVIDSLMDSAATGALVSVMEPVL